jgi:hypothetical protein
MLVVTLACALVEVSPPGAARPSKLEEPGVRRDDAVDLGAEVDEHRDVLLDSYDMAETVLVVAHLVLHDEMGQWWGWHLGNVEGTSRQGTPGRGFSRFHSF